jgi:hypothetical protein
MAAKISGYLVTVRLEHRVPECGMSRTQSHVFTSLRSKSISGSTVQVLPFRVVEINTRLYFDECHLSFTEFNLKVL